MEALPAAGNGGLSALLTAIHPNLPSRDPATSPSNPSEKPDPPKAPCETDLPVSAGAREQMEFLETPTIFDPLIEESVGARIDLRG